MAKDFHQDRQLVRPRVVSWMDDHILDLTSLLVLSQPGHDGQHELQKYIAHRLRGEG